MIHCSLLYKFEKRLHHGFLGAGAPVLLLLFNAGALNVTWADTSPSVHAIMACGLPAQTTGTAVRKVLTMDGPGSVPAGRLPDTWPKSMDQV